MLTKISLKKLIDSPKAGDKLPSHAIIASDDKYQNKTQIGKLWLKAGDYGPYLSGELAKDYTNDAGVKYNGYVIITLKEYAALKGTPEVKADTGEVNIDDIPF